MNHLDLQGISCFSDVHLPYQFLQKFYFHICRHIVQQYDLRCMWGILCCSQQKSKVLCSIAVWVTLSISESKILYVVFGGSHVSLNVCKAKCVPGDPVTMHSSLFKGSTSHPCWLCFTCPIVCCDLISKVVLNVLLYVQFYPCGYSIVLPLILCGHVIVCHLGSAQQLQGVCVLTRITLQLQTELTLYPLKKPCILQVLVQRGKCFRRRMY